MGRKAENNSNTNKLLPSKPADTVTSVLILQHPQEPDKELGTAALARRNLKNSKLKTGLSWPNLEKAWGEKCDKENWLVLYLGSAKLPAMRKDNKAELIFVDRRNNLFDDEKNIRSLKDFLQAKKRGIIVLDGTWSQAKTIWWRNAWLNKLKRAVILPPRPSLYGKLRKEPRKESISTIEAIAYSLEILEANSAIKENLLNHFRELLLRYKTKADFD